MNTTSIVMLALGAFAGYYFVSHMVKTKSAY